MSTCVLRHRAKHLVLTRLSHEWRSVYAVLPEVQKAQGGSLEMPLSLLLQHLGSLKRMALVEQFGRGHFRLTETGALMLRGLGPWQRQAAPVTPHGERVRRGHERRAS